MNAASAILLSCFEGDARLWGAASTERGWVVSQRAQARMREEADDETPALVIDVANRRPRSIQDVSDVTCRRLFRGVVIGVREAGAIREALGAPAPVTESATPEPASESVEVDGEDGDPADGSDQE